MAKSDNQNQTPFVPNYLLYLLAASSEAASSQFHRHVRSCGLRAPEWRILACLWDQDGLMVTHLARFSLMEQSRLTHIVDQMNERGLVSRKPDNSDRRKVRVFLTEKGRELSEKIVSDARRHEANLLGMLEDTDAARIKPVLKSLLENLAQTSSS